MGEALKRLVGLGSGSMGGSGAPAPADIPEELRDLLEVCDGFYAFESALHVFPARPDDGQLGILEWNRPDVWRYAFATIPVGCWFFAEDVFGCQFAIVDSAISAFDPEIGEFRRLADDLNGWAAAVLDDWRVLTGHPVAHDWQVRHGPLPPGRRLLPKLPFVLGGEFAVDNVYDADAVLAMRYRGELAAQLRDLPDRSNVRLRIVT